MTLPPSLKCLWLGQLPLQDAFWRYFITYDLLLNLGATLAALMVILARGPVAVAVILHFLPVPYSALAAIGTWRSADRFAGNPSLANAAKLVVLLWCAFWLFF
jgi:hypothetical protein